MGADEEGTHERLQAHFPELVNPKIGEHRGRIVKNTGDGFLAEFPSVVSAVRCAVEIQRAPCQLKQPKREIRSALTVGNPGDLRTRCNRSWCPKCKLDKACRGPRPRGPPHATDTSARRRSAPPSPQPPLLVRLLRSHEGLKVRRLPAGGRNTSLYRVARSIAAPRESCIRPSTATIASVFLLRSGRPHQRGALR